MARAARIVIPGVPHHVTQRGNHRAPIFIEDGDPDVYRNILAAQCRRRNVEVWAYCLMPNHVHLILTPSDETGLSLAIGEAHRRYTAFINGRQGWIGHLFQSRFASVPMDERHLYAAVRYVSLNPVRARLVGRAEEWPWSSVRAHLRGTNDRLVTVMPVLERVDKFADLLLTEDDSGFAALRASESTGRPLGDRDFIARLEAQTGRRIAPLPAGRPRKEIGGQHTYFPFFQEPAAVVKLGK